MNEMNIPVYRSLGFNHASAVKVNRVFGGPKFAFEGILRGNILYSIKIRVHGIERSEVLGVWGMYRWVVRSGESGREPWFKPV